jgi:uncharacterized membrane protein YoaK (UPF0700 family)
MPRFEPRADASVPVSKRAAHRRGGKPTDGAEAPERTKEWLAPLLAAVAGSVDAIGYLTLLHVFTAHMSGNSDAFGAELGRGSWTEVLRRGFPIPVFVLAVALGALVIELAMRRGVRSVVAVVFSVEALLLVAFVGFGSTHFSHHAITITKGWRFYGLVALLVVAMGLQNAGLRRVRGHTVHTTFVTGMLTDLAHESVASVVWWWDGRASRRSGAGGDGPAGRSPSNGRVAMLAGIWTAYVLGAAAGGFGLGRVGLTLLWVPIAVLAVVVVLDLRTPLHTSSVVAGAPEPGGSGQSRSTM